MVTNNSCNYNPTQHAVQVGGTNGSLTSLAVGGNNSILVGSTGADPSMTTTGAIFLTSLSFNAGTDTLSAYQSAVSFTPTISGTTTAGTGTYTTQQGYYTQIGKAITFDVSIVWTAHTGTGNMLLTALPFTIKNSTNYSPEWLANLISIPFPGGTLYIVCEGAANTTQGALTAVRSNNTNNPVVMSATGTLRVSGRYTAA